MISYDEQANEKDQYDRYLCYVTFESTDVNAQLIKKGYARVYTFESFTKKDEYLELETEAIRNSTGLWSCSSKQTGLAIVEVHYDAKGNDAEYLNDEYLVVINNAEQAIDFTGWRITDSQSNSFDFPIGFYLAPNKSLTIYTGSGTNMSTALYLHHDMPLWNNDGDTVIIIDNKGKTRATYTY
jgi:micrococcal nuclease